MNLTIFNRMVRWAIVIALAWLMLSRGGSSAWGQFSLSPSGSSAVPPPYGVTRLGSIEVTTVRFNGAALFEIVSPTVPDRANTGSLIPVEARASLIEANLRRVVMTNPTVSIVRLHQARPHITPENLQVNAAILGGQTVLTVSGPPRSQSHILLTVTQLDADYYGLSIAELAAKWRDILQQALTKALENRQPQKIRQRLQVGGVVVIAVAIISFGLTFLQGFLSRYSDRLQEREVGLDEEFRNTLGSTNDFSINHRLLILAHSGKRLTLELHQGLVAFLRWLLFWAQVLLWFVAVQIVLQATPYTQPLAGWLRETPLIVLLIWFGTGSVNWLGTIAIDRLAAVWRRNDLFSVDSAQRRSLRISTTIRALKGLKTFLVYTIGIVNILHVLRVPTSSVLAFGAILGIAISFGSQSLVKDLVNGCLILLEDQYAIGDVIAVGNLDGLVENMNLRITQIRNAEGRLITIPNSTIAQVENLTRSWSRVDFTIEVAYDSDVNHVLDVTRQVGHDLYVDPDWHELFVEAPEVLGVDRLAHTGILIRVWIKTQPLQQWAVGREFRRRIHMAFQREGIAIGAPQQRLVEKFAAQANNSSTANGNS
ncbi:MAG: mechanosensitive ion channel [Cyanobacteria bacterium]|nr:mechanosensitive ion channel [Cyanobacteriota bacterium]MDW8200848.1 mechanosensitive ion channel [Cyanobacteriota bacterium SKYGB_h_bin112]